jgi:hypothetical protein
MSATSFDMAQIFFSTPLPPGATSADFTLPGANTDKGSRVFSLIVNRDLGAMLPDGTFDANQDAVITVRQLAGDGVTQLTLATLIGTAFTPMTSFMPDARGGVLSIVNSGPGNVCCVQVTDDL